MKTLQSLSLQSLFKVGDRFKTSLVPTCKMTYSGYYLKIGFILSCMSLTLAPEKLFTLTLCFRDSRPGCKPETTESCIFLWPWTVFTIVRCYFIIYISVSLMQIDESMDSSLACVFGE